MVRMRWTMVLAALACLAIAGLTACGDDDNDKAAKTSTSEGKAATGKPINVLSTSFVDAPFGSVPEIWTGAEVAAKNINEAGGIDGRPIKIVTCNGKGDPKAEEACARKGVSEDAVASSGNIFVANAGGAMEVLQRAQISDIAGATGDPAALALDNAYPISFDAASVNACGAPTALDAAGDDAKVGAVVEQTPFGKGAFSLLEPYLKSPEVGDKYVGSVSVAPTQQDFSSIVQDLDDKGANYVIPALAPGGVSKVVSAAGTSGKKWTFCADAGSFPPPLLAKLAPLTKGFFTSGGFPPTSSADKYPLIARFVKEMEATQKGSLESNPIAAMRAWIGVFIISEVARGIDGDVTAESFANAMKTAKVDLDYADVDFSKPLGKPPFVRQFQPNAFVSRWNSENKEAEDLGQVNLVETLGQ